MARVAVVGAGLFGAIAAKALHQAGHQVSVLDSSLPNAGSPPAACLMKPSWFSGMGAAAQASLELLGRLYRLEEISFKVGPVTAPVHWIDPRSILAEARETRRDYFFSPEQVNGVEPDGTLYIGPHKETFDHVVLAMGNHTGIIPWRRRPDVRPQAGVAFLFPNAQIRQPFISPWAPYKQIVAFNRGDGLWISDGTALKPESLTEERINVSYNRCLNALRGGREHQIWGSMDESRRLVGHRPYVKDAKPAYCETWEEGRVTVITGGAKNGTIAAGWCAWKLLGELDAQST